MYLFKVDFKSKTLLSTTHVPSSSDNTLLGLVMDAYDCLKAQYRENMPKGGIYNSHPVTQNKRRYYVDCYGDGNVANSTHDRHYINRGNSRWNSPIPFPAHVRKFEGIYKTSKNITLGYKSDSFMWMEMKYRVTLYFLTQLVENKYTGEIKIYTRSDLIAHDDYIQLLKRLNCKVIFYIPRHRNEDNARIEEPGAPSIKRRLSAMKKLKQAGIKTYVKNTEVVATRAKNSG